MECDLDYALEFFRRFLALWFLDFLLRRLGLRRARRGGLLRRRPLLLRLLVLVIIHNEIIVVVARVVIVFWRGHVKVLILLSLRRLRFCGLAGRRTRLRCLTRGNGGFLLRGRLLGFIFVAGDHRRLLAFQGRRLLPGGIASRSAASRTLRRETHGVGFVGFSSSSSSLDWMTLDFDLAGMGFLDGTSGSSSLSSMTVTSWVFFALYSRLTTFQREWEMTDAVAVGLLALESNK